MPTLALHAVAAQGPTGHAGGRPCCPNGRAGAALTDAPRRLVATAPADPTIGRMIHDVDELLEKLVRRDALNGSAVELVFDAPTKDWVARRNGPAVDLYLYDIREDLQRRVPAWEDVRERRTGTVTRRGSCRRAGSGWRTSSPPGPSDPRTSTACCRRSSPASSGTR